MKSLLNPTVAELADNMMDLAVPEMKLVEVSQTDSGFRKCIWVNVQGVCVLRISEIPKRYKKHMVENVKTDATFFGTFGGDFVGYYYLVRTDTMEQARRTMFDLWGNRWAFVYPISELPKQIKRYNLVELTEEKIRRKHMDVNKKN